MRRIGLFFVVAAALVGVILVWRASRFSSRQVQPGPAEPLAIDSAEAIRRLALAIRIPTISRDDSLLADSVPLADLHRLLEQSFPRIRAALSREVINGGSLLYRWQGTDTSLPALLLASHLDVVPADSAGWSHLPFSGDVAGGYVWGRGALDDKVGVLGALEAVEALLGLGFRPHRTVYLAFGGDEEVGGRAGAVAIAAELARRGIRLEAVVDEGGLIVQGIVPGVSAPVATVGVAEKGNVSIGLEAHVSGGHSSMPPARTAIGVLSAAISRLERNQFPASLRASRGLFEAVGPEMAWPSRVLFANLWLFEPIVVRRLTMVPSTAAAVRTTIAPTIMRAGTKENVLPGVARAVVNLRILSGETVAGTVDRVRRVVADSAVSVSVIGTGDEPSPVSSADAPPFRALAGAIRQIHPDAVVAPFLVLGATDSRHYASLTANIYRFVPLPVGGADLTRIHGTDERVSVADYVNAVRVYAQIIRALAP
ncbi:MAG TPA: M20 family peptidase [Gemmatimonadales bacterium]